MKFPILLGLFNLVTTQRDGGTPQPTAKPLSHVQLTSGDLSRFSTPFTNAIIEVYFHVITNSKEEGSIPTQTILKQMKLLNAANASSHIQFELLELDIT
jgi:hypothetical protein